MLRARAEGSCEGGGARGDHSSAGGGKKYGADRRGARKDVGGEDKLETRTLKSDNLGSIKLKCGDKHFETSEFKPIYKVKCYADGIKYGLRLDAVTGDLINVDC